MQKRFLSLESLYFPTESCEDGLVARYYHYKPKTCVILPALVVFLQQPSPNRHNTSVVGEIARIITEEVDQSNESAMNGSYEPKIELLTTLRHSLRWTTAIADATALYRQRT